MKKFCAFLLAAALLLALSVGCLAASGLNTGIQIDDSQAGKILVTVADSDSPRQVHWKLSQKYGKLIVKDASLPITRSAALFWERTESQSTNARTDAEAEIVVSLCRNLLAQSVQFTLCWNENSQLVRHLVRDLDELIALLPRLLTAKAEAAISGAKLLLQTVPAGAYSHLIYVSGEQPAGPNLQTLGHLTALVCGADYSETDYMNQLSELTI